ncbi:hypothetical protein IW261DRAFT_1564671 [Armillaria novae-zelandiae]|uniref:DUF4470 domain-containing protein n=1 Tax=Armillaria novae-zelandiae TaxID=153914 RepID=A0AA39U7N3_9AGAR|nr:hypothetical protein IW261DRAFT_1564671 [Armillaria novae-zelandiae]
MSWYPAWVREDRKPTFVAGGSQNDGFRDKAKVWQGNGPWGSHDSNRHLSVAFMACGYLQNVVKTIKGLPDYSGTIKIVLNDMNAMVLCPDLIILSIPGIIEDAKAAEHARRVWYLIFLSPSFRTRVTLLLARASSLEPLDGTLAPLTSSTTTYTK